MKGVWTHSSTSSTVQWFREDKSRVRRHICPAGEHTVDTDRRLALSVQEQPVSLHIPCVSGGVAKRQGEATTWSHNGPGSGVTDLHLRGDPFTSIDVCRTIEETYAESAGRIDCRWRLRDIGCLCESRAGQQRGNACDTIRRQKLAMKTLLTECVTATKTVYTRSCQSLGTLRKAKYREGAVVTKQKAISGRVVNTEKPNRVERKSDLLWRLKEGKRLLDQWRVGR